MIGKYKKQRDIMDMAFIVRKPTNLYLDKIDEMIDWALIEKVLMRGYKKSERGRPTRDLVVLFKSLLLQAWYNLSDPGLEEAINDRLSFQRFLGLSLSEQVPDETTFWRFRERHQNGGTLKKAFDEINRQFKKKGLIIERGTLIDATIKQSSYRPDSVNRITGELRESKDKNAAFVSKRGKTTYGYKMHIGTDLGSDLIKRVSVTPANEHDSTQFERLMTGQEKSVFADKAYAKRERKRRFRDEGIYCGILDKGYRNKPLGQNQIKRNKRKSRIRNRVERIFAVTVKDCHYLKTRYTNLARNTAQALFLCMAYNLKRGAVLWQPT